MNRHTSRSLARDTGNAEVSTAASRQSCCPQHRIRPCEARVRLNVIEVRDVERASPFASRISPRFSQDGQCGGHPRTTRMVIAKLLRYSSVWEGTAQTSS